MKLAEQIKKHRKKNNLTQDQLATELHTTRQTISKWEQGTIEPNAQMIVQLANKFGISTDELLTGEETTLHKEEVNQPSQHLNFWDFLSQKWWFVLIIVVIICGTITQIFTS
ncbi:helix-turn-helix transcriptional regulator [Staphylococcus sp. NRL 16/872]|uniref:helix-turn-helix domain-containing protein n=1 Tax=Staphylococcus sp. NRL 16/872 TaxID=2930131 RepID=UPI001FB37189|nr:MULTISPECIES: helix-turn-helix transcriptional regulator [unclassified Staphylococcus]MCJ1655336.1 helix-turn-helix domain-containing protein [Staphylococcus sp. NRL 21/187]MCJ1661173.1 helix-turn-helix domain-containing protein [Staphylococcus sp. NRL 18/288]MCJ1667064.1 helix-turn-helix domain-containing protein [Staphylococcus sp. NRL 19/737]WEN69539.1 helix-turn-helix transcriptional regulator [Staphylococcus sp. NRL 16/872]